MADAVDRVIIPALQCTCDVRIAAPIRPGPPHTSLYYIHGIVHAKSRQSPTPQRLHGDASDAPNQNINVLNETLRQIQFTLNFRLSPVAHTNVLPIHNTMSMNKNAKRAVLASCAIASSMALARSQGTSRTRAAPRVEYS